MTPINSKQRFLATIERKAVDRPACWLGFPDAAALPGLFAEYGVADLPSLKRAIGDDVEPVELPYHSPQSDAIYAAFDFAGKGSVDAQNRTLTTEGRFAHAEDVSEVDAFDWPEPERHIDPEACRDAARRAANTGRATLGMLWSAHYQDVCAAFGMENALVAMLERPELVEAVDARIVDFYLRANEVFYRAAGDALTAVLIGNDLGSQQGLMLSPALIRRFVLPGARRLIAQAHDHGCKVIYHSCGAIAEIIPDLIEAGADAIHPIQALAAGMRAEDLKQRFGDRVSFCGGIDTQHLLVRGSCQDVRDAVLRLRERFPTGLILSPSHEAILPDVSPRNVRAMFEAAKAVLI